MPDRDPLLRILKTAVRKHALQQYRNVLFSVMYAERLYFSLRWTTMIEQRSAFGVPRGRRLVNFGVHAMAHVELSRMYYRR